MTIKTLTSSEILDQRLQYLDEALACIELASTATTAEYRATFNTIANAWLQLARTWHTDYLQALKREASTETLVIPQQDGTPLFIAA